MPIVAGGALRGVFDMDSPTPARFDDANRIGVERLVAGVRRGDRLAFVQQAEASPAPPAAP